MKTPRLARNSFATLVLAASMTFGLGSCASSQNSSNGNTYTRTANGAVVQVSEDEYHIHMPTTIPSGAITFHITNAGTKSHNFKIKGNGVEQQLPADLTPGQTADLNVTLTPGTYSVICPILGHPELGMNLTLNVVSGL